MGTQLELKSLYLGQRDSGLDPSHAAEFVINCVLGSGRKYRAMSESQIVKAKAHMIKLFEGEL